MIALRSQIVAKFTALLRAMGDLVLPELCGACQGADVSSRGLCDKCLAQLLKLVCLPYCPRCGSTTGPNIPVRQDGCPACPPTLPRFARVVRIGPYADPLRHAIRNLKYRGRQQLRNQLADLLAQATQSAYPDKKFDVIVPIPMHWISRLTRGSDHAMLLAAATSRRLDVPLGKELIRMRNNPPQARLSRTQRIENIKGAFELADAKTIDGANVLLVDDVTTTGATANEATRILLEAGAEKVTLAVIAKTESPIAYANPATSGD